MSYDVETDLIMGATNVNYGNGVPTGLIAAVR